MSRSARSTSERRLASIISGLLVAVMLVAMSGAAAPGLARQATPSPATVPTPDPIVEPLERAVAYLLARQTPDGGFIGFTGEPDAGVTADAIIALKAADFRGVAVGPAIGLAADYLEAEAATYAQAGPGQAAKLVLAAVAAGRDPMRFGGVDLLAAATDASGATPVSAALPPGIYGDDMFDHALVMLALAAANREVPVSAVDALRNTQLGDGSWGFSGETDAASGDSNTTALSIQALVASGNGTDPMVEAAYAYLKTVQTTTGQFAFEAGEPLVPDANSTALAVQAIVATGQNPSSAEAWGNAARGLAAFQNVSGAFRYQDVDPADNLFATLQGVPALAGLPLPLAVACEADAPAADAATPVIALPAPGRGMTPCVALEPAA